MKILLTGAAGFIGTYLYRELHNAGYDLLGVDYNDGDLSLPDIAHRIIDKYKPHIVIHLAAKVGRLFGEEDPTLTIASNALATTYVAKACGDSGIKLVYASTSEAFGDPGNDSLDENDPGRLPHNLYGLSKRWGEEAAQLYAPEGLQILRFSMPYGPGLPAGHGRAAIITFLWQAHHRKPITVHHGGRRCLCWIGDLVSAIRLVIENGNSGAWTIGRNDNETLMLDVARMACDIADTSPDLIKQIEAPANQTVVKRLNIDRLTALGWEPCVGLLAGMKRTYKVVKLYDEEGMPPAQWRLSSLCR
jgi:nucleoside-diphosphate-sugar epimerase